MREGDRSLTVEELEKALYDVMNTRRAPVDTVYKTLIRMVAQSCLHLTAGGLEHHGRPFTLENATAAAEGSLRAFTEAVAERIARVAPEVVAEMKQQMEDAH